MTRRVKFGIAAIVVVGLLSAPTVAADPAPSRPPPADYLRMREPATLISKGITYDLPPGRWMSEPRATSWEAELKSLQDAKTRLTAENGSLRDTASGWTPGWKTLATTLIVGISIGVYASSL